jgi:hypothetical protein
MMQTLIVSISIERGSRCGFETELWCCVFVIWKGFISINESLRKSIEQVRPFGLLVVGLL